MRKNSRAGKIFQAGLDAIDECPDCDTEHLLAALAAMIDYATAKKVKEKKKLLYNEHDVLRVLNYELAVTRHGSLNRQLGTMQLRDDDLPLFEAWFRDVMYPWMQSKEDFAFTYSMLTRKYPEWLEKARQYDGKSTPDRTQSWR